MIKIIIAEDHPILRKGLVNIFNATNQFRIVAEVSTVEKLITKTTEIEFDVVLLDLTIPKKGGIWALSEIMHQSSDNKVIIFSASDEKQIVLTTLSLGAKAFVNKGSDTDEIFNAIIEVANGNTYISPSIEKKNSKEIKEYRKNKPQKLSKREMQCFTLAGEGKTLTQIAEILGLSVKTVSTYKTRIFAKLALKNNSELIKFAINYNLKSSYFIDEVN